MHINKKLKNNNILVLNIFLVIKLWCEIEICLSQTLKIKKWIDIIILTQLHFIKKNSFLKFKDQILNKFSFKVWRPNIKIWDKNELQV